MRELWELIITTYNDYRGTGKLFVLFIVSVLIIYIINCSVLSDEDRKNTVDPLIFILCPAAGIGYAFTLVYEAYLTRERTDAGRIRIVFLRILMGLAIMLTLTLSGRLVFMAETTGELLPLILVPAYLAAYTPAAGRLFKDKRLKWFMVLCILVLNLWGYQSQELLPVTMFYGRFSLPAIIVHGILPLVLWITIDKYRKFTESSAKADETDKEGLDYYEWEEEDMKNHKIINSRNLAIALLIVVIMLLGSVFVMNRKINNLYETTVNLQEQIEQMNNNKAD